MNIESETFVLKFEDVSIAEATSYVSELREMLLSEIPDMKIADLPNTAMSQDMALAIGVEIQSFKAYKEALNSWFQLHPTVSLTIQDLSMGYQPVFAPIREGIRYRCPCCHYKTLEERGGYDICPVCFWEDDGQDDHNADSYSGPNRMSLIEAREHYRRLGAIQERLIQYVRPSLSEEI